jgi:competence protein ComEA
MMMESRTRVTMLQAAIWALIGFGAILIVWQMLTPVTDSAQPVVVTTAVPVCAPAPTEHTPAPPALVVYVSGAVNAPGLYQAHTAMRVGEMVALAGGFTEGAEVAQLNMAEPIYDAMHIHVPTQTPAGMGSPAVSKQQSVLNINQATVNELEALPGIGPSLAQRIVAYREAHGAFVDAEALSAVPGIGDALIQKILALIVFA